MCNLFVRDGARLAIKDRGPVAYPELALALSEAMKTPAELMEDLSMEGAFREWTPTSANLGPVQQVEEMEMAVRTKKWHLEHAAFSVRAAVKTLKVCAYISTYIYIAILITYVFNRLRRGSSTGR